MKDLFYIVEVSPQWFNLRTTTDHYTLAFGSNVDRLLEVVYKYCVKYKTEERLVKRLRQFEDKGMTPQKTLEYYKKQYSERGHLFDHLIREQVEKAIQYNKENTPFKKAKKKVTPLIKITPRDEVKETTTLVPHKRRGLKKIVRLA